MLAGEVRSSQDEEEEEGEEEEETEVKEEVTLIKSKDPTWQVGNKPLSGQKIRINDAFEQPIHRF